MSPLIRTLFKVPATLYNHGVVYKSTPEMRRPPVIMILLGCPESVCDGKIPLYRSVLVLRQVQPRTLLLVL